MIDLTLFRRARVILVAGLCLTGLGCSSIDEILEANNPAQIREDQLDDATLITVMVNSVTGAITGLYSGHITRAAMFTDEMLYGINDEQSARLNLRIVRTDEGGGGAFTGVSTARFLADSITGRLRKLLPTPNSDIRLARVLAYAGYSYTLMGELMCEATLNVGAKLYTPKELGELAITRFEEAITVATAAGATGDSIRTMARVGLARAALMAGNNAKAMSAAALVPITYNWWVEYKDQVTSNGLVGNVTGANHNLGVGVKFVNGVFEQQNLVATQTDPRIQHMRSWRLGHNQLTKLYTPYQSLPFSGFNGQTIATGGTPILYTNDTDIKLASGIEAMHHYYEAAGPNGTGPRGTTLAFVNERRAFGRQTPVNLTGAALMAELREQRGKDFFLGGFRLGDLRRWKSQGLGDFFPTGNHPNVTWGPYGTAECYPLPINEYVGNPNIKR